MQVLSPPNYISDPWYYLFVTSLGDILKDRIKRFPVGSDKECEEYFSFRSNEYQKKWNFAVKCFQDKINKDRNSSNLKPLPFIAVRQKLIALWEIDDLRWFYRECIRYSTTYAKEKDIKGNPLKNTFSQAFFGALKIR